MSVRLVDFGAGFEPVWFSGGHLGRFSRPSWGPPGSSWGPSLVRPGPSQTLARVLFVCIAAILGAASRRGFAKLEAGEHAEFRQNSRENS
eukprot:2044410-Pyramimonas_sp.AAC.1